MLRIEAERYTTTILVGARSFSGDPVRTTLLASLLLLCSLAQAAFEVPVLLRQSGSGEIAYEIFVPVQFCGISALPPHEVIVAGQEVRLTSHLLSAGCPPPPPMWMVPVRGSIQRVAGVLPPLPDGDY